MTKDSLLLAFTVLLPLAFFDLIRRKVPRSLVFAGLASAAAAAAFTGAEASAIAGNLMKACAAVLPFLLISLFFDRLFAKKTLGGGDLWFLLLEFSFFPEMTVVTGLLAGLVMSLPAALRNFRKPGKPRAIPLTPYLLLGLEAVLILNR